MSVASTLLRVVLMLSLLFNGLNVAMASAQAMPATAETAAKTAPPCHTHADMAAEPLASQLQAPIDDSHCKLKDCLRACAQQPALAATGALLLPVAPADAGPFPQHATDLPTPSLQRIQRPPIG